MKRINLDAEDDHIKTFVRSLPLDPDGSVLEINGEPVIRVLPPSEVKLDAEQLRKAILSRRNESRESNQQWTDADRNLWSRTDEE